MEVARTELPLCYYTPFYLNVDNNRDALDKCRLKSELIVIMGVLRFTFFGWGENLVSLFLENNFLFNLRTLELKVSSPDMKTDAKDTRNCQG